MKANFLVIAAICCADLAAAQEAKKKPRPEPAPITINIGEEDVGPSRPTQSSKAAADPAVNEFRRAVLSEINVAEDAAKASETSESAFPHHVKAIFLKLITEDFVKAQYSWAQFPKDMFAKLGELKSPEEAKQLQEQLNDSAEIFDDLVKTLTGSPEKIADELLNRDYEPAIISKRLAEVLKNSPLPTLRNRYEVMAEAARTGAEFTATAARFWGKWVVRDGNFGLAQGLSAQEREQLEKAAVSARTAISKANDVK